MGLNFGKKIEFEKTCFKSFYVLVAKKVQMLRIEDKYLYHHVNFSFHQELAKK